MGLSASVLGAYGRLWSSVIRPPRDEYEVEDLGPARFHIGGAEFTRLDLTLVNERGQNLACSHFQPRGMATDEKLPCVVYLHGSTSSRMEALSVREALLPRKLSLFCFDFAGSGMSEGDYVSLGYWERSDLTVVVRHLRESNNVSSIALWGRSMGAVVAVLMAGEDSGIAACVLDSPFSSFPVLMQEVAREQKVPALLATMAIKTLRSEIKSRSDFDVENLVPIKSAPLATAPARFILSAEDTYVLPHHTRDLCNKWGAADKQVQSMPGGHNAQRPKSLMDDMADFLEDRLSAEAEVSERHSEGRSESSQGVFPSRMPPSVDPMGKQNTDGTHSGSNVTPSDGRFERGDLMLDDPLADRDSGGPMMMEDPLGDRMSMFDREPMAQVGADPLGDRMDERPDARVGGGVGPVGAGDSPANSTRRESPGNPGPSDMPTGVMSSMRAPVSVADFFASDGEDGSSSEPTPRRGGGGGRRQASPRSPVREVVKVIDESTAFNLAKVQEELKVDREEKAKLLKELNKLKVEHEAERRRNEELHASLMSERRRTAELGAVLNEANGTVKSLQFQNTELRRVAAEARKEVGRLQLQAPEDKERVIAPRRTPPPDVLVEAKLLNGSTEVAAPTPLEMLRGFHVQNRLRRASLYIIATQLSEARVKALQKAFQNLDSNSTCRLTLMEVKACLIKAGIEVVPPDLTGLAGFMVDVDPDGSGVVDYLKFLAAVVEEKHQLTDVAINVNQNGGGEALLDHADEVLGLDALRGLLKDLDVSERKIGSQEFLDVLSAGGGDISGGVVDAHLVLKMLRGAFHQIDDFTI